MQVSRFNFLVPSPRESNVTFLYNSLHDNRIAVEEDSSRVKEFFQKIRDHQALNSEEVETADSLKELGYLLDDDVNEEEVFNEWFHGKVKEQTEILTATIVTTMACNLRCTYCFERESLGKNRMTPETMEKTVQWLQTRINNSRPKKVNLIFFGGEPLINTDAIRKISGDLYPYCKDRDIEYSSGAITNGIFLTPKLVDELKLYGFNWVKITFDGDQEHHDKKRIYAGGRGTFERIFSNLESIAGKLKISIGGNFDEENADSFKKLLTKIQSANFKKDIVYANFTPIMAEMTESEKKEVQSLCVRCALNDFQIKKMTEIRDEVRKIGLKPGDPINGGPCEFYRRDAVTIGVDGELYKCGAFVGLKSTTVGDISRQEYNSMGEAMLSASNPFQNPKCKKCPFPPICGGGCRADAYNNTGDFNQISCQQDYFKQTISVELPKEHYEGVESTLVNEEVF